MTATARNLTPRRGYVLFMLCTVYALSVLDRNILAILLQSIREDLHLSDTQLGLVSGLAFAVFYVTLAVPIARLADLWKRTRVIAISLAIFSVMTALCSVASNFLQLLLFRVGVGIGEAGTTPSSTSVIADLYPEESRGRAMALFAIGGSCGVFIGFSAGGVIALELGWRAAILMVSIPGILVALLVHLTIPEPKRGAENSVLSATHDASFTAIQVFAYLWGQKSLRHITAGVALVLLFGYGFQTWLPSYLQRSFDMNVADVGFIMGVPYGILSVFGMLAAGYFVDRIGRRDPRWRSWIVAAAVGITFPFCVLTVMLDQKGLAIAAYAIPATLGTFYVAPMFAMVQSLAPPRMRAMAVATVLAIANIIGMGLGPQLVGMASDALSARFGEESLRYALLAVTPIILWTVLHFYWAAKYLPDMARARGEAHG